MLLIGVGSEVRSEVWVMSGLWGWVLNACVSGQWGWGEEQSVALESSHRCHRGHCFPQNKNTKIYTKEKIQKATEKIITQK